MLKIYFCSFSGAPNLADYPLSCTLSSIFISPVNTRSKASFCSSEISIFFLFKSKFTSSSFCSVWTSNFLAFAAIFAARGFFDLKFSYGIFPRFCVRLRSDYMKFKVNSGSNFTQSPNLRRFILLYQSPASFLASLCRILRHPDKAFHKLPQTPKSQASALRLR